MPRFVGVAHLHAGAVDAALRDGAGKRHNILAPDGRPLGIVSLRRERVEEAREDTVASAAFPSPVDSARDRRRRGGKIDAVARGERSARAGSLHQIAARPRDVDAGAEGAAVVRDRHGAREGSLCVRDDGPERELRR